MALDRDEGPLGFRALATGQGFAGEQVGLIVPSSLCSGQIARMIADKLKRDVPMAASVYCWSAMAT